MILMLDNYDSFTYNLVQYLNELGAEVVVHRNDQISVAEIEKLNPEKIIISPGPCTPNEAGISLELLQKLASKIPMLGVCLGHQALGQAFGGDVIHANKPMHGKTGAIHHNSQGVFTTLPSPFRATRYHSLVVAKKSLPNCFIITAWTEDENGEMDEIMGLKHREYLLEGVQFHPESIATEHGHALLDNFLRQK